MTPITWRKWLRYLAFIIAERTGCAVWPDLINTPTPTVKIINGNTHFCVGVTVNYVCTWTDIKIWGFPVSESFTPSTSKEWLTEGLPVYHTSQLGCLPSIGCVLAQFLLGITGSMTRSSIYISNTHNSARISISCWFYIYSYILWFAHNKEPKHTAYRG